MCLTNECGCVEFFFKGKMQRGKTALHLAARSGNTIVISLLLDRGADIDALDEVSQR